VFTLAGDKLPGGRGFGEPVKLMVDIDGDAQPLALIVARAELNILLAGSDGRGFLAEAQEIVAETRKGKQVVNLKPGVRLRVARPVGTGHDYVAAIGDNRKLVIFPLADLPIMTRGAGVQLQRYRDGGLADATTLTYAEGLSWTMGGSEGRTRTETDLTAWRAARGAAGRMPPTGFPKDNRFSR
jgi:topoisomerase IV subunit A